MTNGVGFAHKIDKQNRQRPDSTTDSSNVPSTTSNFNGTTNEKNDITSKE